VPRNQELVDPGDDVGGGRAGSEDLRHALGGQLDNVGIRDDAAAEHHDVTGALLLEQLDDPREQGHMRTGQHGQTDRVHVLLDRGGDDLLRGLMQAGVDDLDPGVAQRAGYHLRPPVVPVQAGLGDDDADLA
jgi:hypothetical protein